MRDVGVKSCPGSAAGFCDMQAKSVLRKMGCFMESEFQGCGMKVGHALHRHNRGRLTILQSYKGSFAGQLHL